MSYANKDCETINKTENMTMNFAQIIFVIIVLCFMDNVRCDTHSQRLYKDLIGKASHRDIISWVVGLLHTTLKL